MVIDWELALKLFGAAGPLVGGGGVWAYMSARATKAASIGTSQASLVEALNQQTKLLLGESTKDRRQLKRRLDRQEGQLAKVIREVADCHSRHEDCEKNLYDVREQISALMQDNPPATYPNGGADG